MEKKNNDLDIVVILDRSGSMERIWSATISMFNEFKNEQADEKGKTRMTLVSFSKSHSYTRLQKRKKIIPTYQPSWELTVTGTRGLSEWEYYFQTTDNSIEKDVKVIYLKKDIKEIPNLTKKSYRPKGGTNLLDAVGHTINEADSSKKELTECGKCGHLSDNTKTLVVIITDGEENSSEIYTANDIRRLIGKKEEQGWKFLYLGANQDAWDEGMSMGVSGEDTFSYSATDTGIGNIGQTVTAYASGYRAGDDTSSLRDTAKKLGIEDATGRK